MATGKPTDPALKAEILDQARNNGMTVLKASKAYGIRANVIYGWMQKESVVSQSSLMAELNRTKRELENAYMLIGKLTAEKNIPNSKR